MKKSKQYFANFKTYVLHIPIRSRLTVYCHVTINVVALNLSASSVCVRPPFFRKVCIFAASKIFVLSINFTPFVFEALRFTF